MRRAGYDGMLEITQETMDYLDECKVPFTVARTPDAVELYKKKVADGVNIGILLHTTC